MFHSFKKIYQAKKILVDVKNHSNVWHVIRIKKKKKTCSKKCKPFQIFSYNLHPKLYLSLFRARVNFKQDYEIYKFQGINCRKLQVSIETTTKKE